MLIDKSNYIHQNYSIKLNISIFGKLGALDHSLSELWSYVGYMNTQIYKNKNNIKINDI